MLNRKNLALAITLVVMSSISFGQSQASKGILIKDIKAEYPTTAISGFETQEASAAESPMMMPQQTLDQNVIGQSYYDLQTNYSIQNRFVNHPILKSASWTFSLQTSPFNDRGTGYNHYNGAWDAQPTTRLESIRTGWSSLIHTGSGSEISIAHQASGPLVMMKRPIGIGAWTQSTVPTAAEDGIFWPRAVSGGNDGNTIHMIGLTIPIGNGGALYNGQDGALLYFRSQDEGATWDQVDVHLPELDATHFLGFQGDAYAIHARGLKVTIAVFGDWQDSILLTSLDGGNTWTSRTLVDFPIDLFDWDNNLLDQDGNLQADTVHTTDKSGAVYIGSDMLTHVSYGYMNYLDDIQFDGVSSYFPFTDGLGYWNENMPDDTSIPAAFTQDLDGDEFLNIIDVGAYFTSLTSHPQIGEDALGNLYMSYQGIVESHFTGFQNFRHIHAITSSDSGASWSIPVDLTPDVQFIGYESVFASMDPVVDTHLHLIYQRDLEPGLHVRGDEDPVDLNDIVYLNVTTDLDTTPTGCTDNTACNYNPLAVIDNGSCDFSCLGCTDSLAINYDSSATINDGSCISLGCDQLGDESWASLDMGMHPVLSTHEYGDDVDQDLVLNILTSFTDPASGNTFTVISATVDSISGYPFALGYSVSGVDNGTASALAGEQICTNLSGIAAQSGVFNVLVHATVTVNFFGNDIEIPADFTHVMTINPPTSEIPGCLYPTATNYNLVATIDDGGCVFEGCTIASAANYSPLATIDDGSCIFASSYCALGTTWDPNVGGCLCLDSCMGDLNGDLVVNTSDMLIFLTAFSTSCE